jgi:hypothetical protein
LIVRWSMFISLSWCTVSKNLSKSMSTTQSNPLFISSKLCLTAISQLLKGLNP